MKQKKFRIKMITSKGLDENYFLVTVEKIFKVQVRLLPGLWITLRKFSSDVDGVWAAEASAKNMLDALNKEGL